MTRRAALLAAALLLAACGGSPSPAATPTPSASPSPTPTPTPTAPALKPPLAGLLTRDGPPPAAYLQVMGGYVVNVHWADLQAVSEGPLAPGNPIDQAIAQVRQLDPSGRLGLRVRLFAGIWAPAWAKSIGGAPVPVRDPTTGATGTIGRFWTTAFGAAYLDLETKLAALYDEVPEVREITVSRCTTVYAEPFIRDTGDAATVAALQAAGFTTAADHACLEDELSAHRVWVHTRSDLSFNPYQIVGGGAHDRNDESFTEQVMGDCRDMLGARCVLENNSLRTPPLYTSMYAAMQAKGPPLTFQTATLDKVGDLGQTLDYAVALGAGSVELPGGFDTANPPEVLAPYSNRLATNAARARS